MIGRDQIGVLAALSLFALAPAAAAQSGPTLSVGTITSSQTCTIYREYAGSAGAVVTPDAIGMYASWRSWLVKDCVDNFAAMRLSLQAALASGGGVRVQGGGGRYVVSGRISEVSGGGARPTPDAPDGKSFAISRNLMTVNMDVTVRDARGAIVFGGLLTKTIEVGSDIKVDGFQASSNMSGEAAYTRLQHEVALAVARMVAFHFSPLRITPLGGKTVGLNYGAPLLTLGTIVQAIGSDGQPIRFRVIAAEAGGATAEIDGDGDLAMLRPDGIATVIEADDPAANGRRFRKVDLP